ncbi:NHL repeat-containing protein 2 [Lycorma delicatula]|uniref:NHL repeat-containing protein 2 n=1 Tax=Lycorma delicatula TaxID=130591 RepID=UPI003F5195AB
MSNIFDLSELRANLIESLSAESGEKSRKEIVKAYLEKIGELENSYTVKDFKKGLEWINVTEPLSLKTHLKGKIIILDFFTYCCINCMHILPDLKVLENQFSTEDGLVVIGVHSPKFSNERKTANVAAAVERYEILHPVVNDAEETMWESLGVCCWPTLVVVGPNGDVLLELMGEGHKELLQCFISECLIFFKSKGILSNHPLPQIQPFQHTFPSSAQPLLYPGKIIVSNNLVAIADTGHHRVVILDTSGKVQHVVGGPDSGFVDGSFSEARFHALQGIAFYSSSILFVADTENHAIRQIDLTSCLVKTLVGTGKQSNDRFGGKLWTAQAISSPWDLCIVKEHVLIIAMAGTHQIWALFLEDTVWWKNKKYTKGVCAAIAGSGREENRNNSYPMSSAFAQPSGLCFSSSFDGIFIADSESSTVRKLHVSDGQVLSVVGGTIDPRNLFGFGDIDGKGVEAKLQHPLGVTWSESHKTLYVADTYNHKIKLIDPSNKSCTTLVDENMKPFKFNEPGGLYVVEDNLYVADTNNHQIVIVNLKSKITNNLVVQLSSKSGEKNKGIPVVEERTLNLSSHGGNLNIKIDVILPDGATLTSGAPSKWSIELPAGCKWLVNTSAGIGDKFYTSEKWAVKINELNSNNTENNIQICCFVFYCLKDVCSSKKVAFLIHIDRNNNAPESAECTLKYVIS